MYDLEKLMETFLLHGTQSEEDKGEMIRRFKENNPGEPVPAHMTEPFNICFALYAICKEIDKLKIELGGWK